MKRLSLPISIKIFVLIVFIVSAAITIISWRNSDTILSILTKNFQSMSLNMGEQMGTELEKFVIRIDNELFRIIQKIILKKGKNTYKIYKTFLDSYSDVEGFLLLRQKKEKFQLIGGRFQGRDKAIDIKDFDWLKKGIEKNPSRKNHFFLKEVEGREVIVLTRRFLIHGTDIVFWSLSFLRPEALQNFFGSADSAEIALINTDLNVLSTNFKAPKEWQTFRQKKSLTRSLELGIQSAYLGEMEDSLGDKWLTSYYLIEEYGLAVFIKQSQPVVYSKIYSLIRETVLWSILLLLLVILISYLSSRKVTQQLLEVIDASRKISEGKFDLKIPRRSNDEVGELVDSVNTMATKIEALLESEKEKIRFQEELETAKIVQNAFYVAKDFQDDFIRVSGYHKASSECCGDWWTHIKVNEHVEQILIGDATGHGAPAALVTSMVYSIVHSLMESSKDRQKHLGPGEILYHINQVMVKSLNGSMYMTFLAMEVDYKQKILRFANAGHCFPFLMPKDPRQDERLDMASKRKGIKPIFQAGQINEVLGAKENVKFYEGELPLKEGDRIFSYTDGAFEFETEKGKQFGINSLKKLLVKYRKKDIKVFRDEVSEDLEERRNRGSYDDDMTFVAFDFSP